MQLAALLTIVEGFLLLDLIFNWRWILHDLLQDQAIRWKLYACRSWLQTMALGILAVLLFTGLLTAWRQLRRRVGAFLAVFGGLLSLVLWCTEVISLHAIDHILYHRIGELTIVSFDRVGVCLITAGGILVEGSRRRTPGKGGRGSSESASQTDSQRCRRLVRVSQ
jgi:hypothetical protein